MSFNAPGGGFGGAEETLAYLIKAYDMATPVFRAFGAEVEATTRRVQTLLTEMNRSVVKTDEAVVAGAREQEAALAKLRAAYEATGVKSADLAAMQARVAKQGAVSTDAQAAATARSAQKQAIAADAVVASHTRSGASLQRYGKIILETAAAGAAGSLDLAVKFQANSLRMETQAGATAKGLDQIRQGLIHMAGQVGATPNQLANGMYHVVSSMNAVLPAATRVTQELQIQKVAAEGAQVGHSHLEDTTYALSAAMNALHQNASHATHTMGTLNAIVGAGDMTMQDLIDSFKSGLIPAAASFGISLQSIGSALAVMGDMGMRGALAGTRLRMAISLLGAPTKEAATILQTLGLSAKQSIATTHAMADALAKAGVSATQISYDLKKPDGIQVALADLDKHLRQSGLSATGAGDVISRAFGGGRMGSAIMLMAENTDRLKLKFDQINKSANQFGHDWALTSNTFKTQVDKALGALDALAIGFGQQLIPYASTALHDFEDMANWLAKNKVALDILAGAVISFSSIAVGSFLIGKLKDAVGLLQTFGHGIGNMGRWLVGSPMTGMGPATKGALTQAQLEQSLMRGSVAAPSPLTSLVSGSAGLYGVNATQIRVGSLMNPMAVYVASNSPFGTARGEVPAAEPSILPAATAGSKSAQEALDHELTKIERQLGTAAAVSANPILPQFINKGGRYFNPATGKLITEAQAASLSQVPLGAQMAAAEERQLFGGGRGGDIHRAPGTLPLFERGLGASMAPLSRAEQAAAQLSLFGTVPSSMEKALAAEARYAPLGSGSPFSGKALALDALKGKLPSTSGLADFLKGAGGNLMRGVGIAGMGVMGAQMAGSIIPGAAGQKVADIGSFAAIGAGIGSAIEPGVGTALGGIAGAVAGTLKDILSKPSYGQQQADALTRGAHHPAYTAAAQADFAKQLDLMAGIVHPGTHITQAGQGRFGAPIKQEINLDIKSLSVDQLARYMAAAKKAGGDIAGQLEKGWNQYKFQSGNIMTMQLESQLRKMPPAAQAYAVQSAVAFAEGLVHQKRLPKGAAAEMLASVEAEFPGFKRYLGLTGAASIQEFNKALNFSKAKQSVKDLLDSFRTQFPQVTAQMDAAGADINSQSNAVMTALHSIAYGPNSTQAMRKQALADIKQLQSGVAQSFNQMAQLVDSQSQAMAKSVQKGSVSAAQTATTNFNNLQTAITGSVASGAMAADKGFQIIAKTTMEMIKLFGGNTKGMDVSLLSHTAEIASLVTQGKAGVSGLLSASNTLLPAHHALGGKVTAPGYFAGEEAPTHPEYILSTNPAYLPRNKNLWASWAKDVGIPGFRYGGYIDPIPGFSLGRSDMGVDANAPVGTPIEAFGPSRMVGYQSNWYAGQPEMVFQLTGGPDRGRYWYVAEQIVPLAHMGQNIPQGGIVARYAPQGTGIEIGWAANAAGTTLAQATSGYHEGQITPAGASFRALITGSPAGKGLGLAGIGMSSIQAPRVGGGGMVGQIVQGALNMVAGAANQSLSAMAGTAAGVGASASHSGAVESQVAAFMSSAGFNKIAIAGILGNAMQESNMDPNTPGGGLWQQVSNFRGGTGGSVLQQMQTMLPQILGIRNAMNAAKSPGEAAVIFERAFERAGIPALANRIAYANTAYAAGYRQGGRIPAFGHGGMMTADKPTLAMFGENGPETAMFIPHLASGGVYSPVSLGLPDSSMPPAFPSSPSSSGPSNTRSTTVSGTPVIRGNEVVTTETTISYNAKGQETVHTHESIRPLTAKAPKTIHWTLGFNPLTDQIESHTTEQWRNIHAEFTKQSHDAAKAKKQFDFWLKQQVEDTITIGGLPAGVIDATRRTLRTEHLPPGGTNIPLSSKGLGSMTGQGFKAVLTGMRAYLKIDTLGDSINLLTRAMKDGAAHPASRMGQVQATLIKGVGEGVNAAWTAQTKQFRSETKIAQLLVGAPTGSTAASLGLSRVQLRAAGIAPGMITRLAASGTGSTAAYKQQVEQIQNQMLPAFQRDAMELQVAIKAATKTHNKKLKDALLAQLDGVTQAQIQGATDLQQAQTQMVEATYQATQTKLSQFQGAADLVGAVQGLGAGTNLSSIGLTPQILGSMGLNSGQLQGLTGNQNPMAAAQMQNSILGGMRSTDAAGLAQLLQQRGSLKGAALDTANQHILDLSKSIADLTSQINNNLIAAIKATAQTFQDQADIGAGGVDLLTGIGDTPLGTNLGAQGINPGLLQMLGINPATAASVQGYGPASIQGYLSSQNNVLTPEQIAGATRYYNAQNAGIQTELGGPNSGLIGELNYDYSQLPTLTGSDRTDMLNTIRGLAKTISGLDRTMQDNTDAVTKLTSATNASSTMTGQMTGQVGYAYQGQNFAAGMTSDQPIAFPVGS